ncbi:uncharacterized protein LOC143607163 [Bidens hawaiensis]|uniref:uncharacterized protein LOC143607163 n=1 Tax=Bidens hawaiensis TaxID=980011 RepID=UPI00404AF305
MEYLNAFVTQPSPILQNINLENEIGTSTKPPKILRMEDYPSWEAVEVEYIIPRHENGTSHRLSPNPEADIVRFLREKKMINLFQQSIKSEIFQLLQHNGPCHSIWEALLIKDRGNLDMRKSKMGLLKKEFDIFTMVTGESMPQLIERYCNLVNEMKRLGIDKKEYEYIEKLDYSLSDNWNTFIMIQQPNPIKYARLTLARFIENLGAHELELRKKL